MVSPLVFFVWSQTQESLRINSSLTTLADDEKRIVREHGLYEGWSYDEHRADMDRLWRDRFSRLR
jgi:hypothetical protein